MTDRFNALPDDSSKTGNVNHKSNDVTYPQLGLKVLFVGNCFLGGAISLFANAGCKPARDVGDADLLVFLGGEDVDPQLYGEQPMRGTYFNRARDDREMDLFIAAQEAGKPCFGICRGMQFLHVMNGGKLYQHVSNHAGRDHFITDVRTGNKVMASSMHHQMCIIDDTTFPLAVSKGHSGTYAEYTRELMSDRVEDLEACVWPAINAIGVQGHPEVAGLPEYSAYCLTLVEEFLAGGFDDDKIDIKVVPPSLKS